MFSKVALGLYRLIQWCDYQCEWVLVFLSLFVCAIPKLRCNFSLSVQFRSFSVRYFSKSHPLQSRPCMASFHLDFFLDTPTKRQSQPCRRAIIVAMATNQRNQLLYPSNETKQTSFNMNNVSLFAISKTKEKKQMKLSWQ